MGSEPKDGDGSLDTTLATPGAGSPRRKTFDRFVVLEELGEGGMGVVLLAHDPDLDRKVAIKVLRGTASTESRARLVREAQAMAKLDHPNVVTVFEVGVANDQVFIAMELVDAGTLTRWLAAAKRSRREILDMFLAIGAGLAAAHDAGLVHRDFKPDNVLLGTDGRPRVSDFGLVTSGGAVVDTPYYVAPEQFVGAATDARTDQFSFCIALYEALYGERPFAGTSFPALMHHVTTGKVRPRRASADVPDWLRAVLIRGLAVDPAARFGSMGELLAALRSDPSVRRRRLRVLVALGAVVVLAVAGLGLARWSRHRAEARAADQAAEDQRLRAERAAEDLVLDSARRVTTSNPTLAIARIKPLAEKRWREVRAIAAEARLAGVAWSMPSSQQPQSLQLSRDGRRVLACGAAGDVRLHDLETRMSRTIATVGTRASAVFADDERRVVVWSEKRVEIVDVATGARTPVDVAAPISVLATSGTTIYWASANGALWEIDVSGAASQAIQVADPIARLSPSPDGRWLALGGAAHVWLLDRTRRSEPPAELIAGPARAFDWSADGSRLVLLTDHQVIDVALKPEPQIGDRHDVEPQTHVLATDAGAIIAGPQGIANASSSDWRLRWRLQNTIDLEESRDGTIVAAAPDQLVVLGDHGDSTLAVPDVPLVIVRASPASPYVVAAASGRIFVWNLDDVLPHAHGRGLAMAGFAGDDAAITASMDGTVRWLDLTTGAEREIASGPPLVTLVVAPSGRLAVTIDARHTAHLIQVGKPPIEIAVGIDQVSVPTETQIALTTDQGAVELYDLSTGRLATVNKHAEALVSFTTSESWVACGYADVVIWRTSLADGRDETLTPRSAPSSSITITNSGDLFVALGPEVVRWPVGSKELVHHATLDKPLAALAVSNDDYLVAFTDDGNGYRVALSRENTVTDLGTPTGATGAVLSPSTGLVTLLDSGGVDVIDPQVPTHWQFGKGSSFQRPQVSTTGRRILAMDGGEVLVWQIDLPTSAAEMVAWLERMTNAITAPDPERVDWRSRRARAASSRSP